MSGIEAAFCRSAPWRGFARHTVLPWVLDDLDDLGTDVLELGGGSGAMAQELLTREPGIRLTLTDVDPDMVAAARRRLAPFGERATVTLGDGTGLDFPDDSFDTTCTWLMLHHTMTWEAVLAELARVTRPGGLIVGYDLTDTALARAVHRLDGSEHRLIAGAAMKRELRAAAGGETRVALPRAGGVMRFHARVA